MFSLSLTSKPIGSDLIFPTATLGLNLSSILEAVIHASEAAAGPQPPVYQERGQDIPLGGEAVGLNQSAPGRCLAA